MRIRNRQLFLSKPEVELLMDFRTKNPISQWWAVDWGVGRVYACDGYRVLSVQDSTVEPGESDVTYVPTAGVKEHLAKSNLSHLFEVTDAGEHAHVYRHTHTKGWTFDGPGPWGDEVPEGVDVAPKRTPIRERPLACPSIEVMDRSLRTDKTSVVTEARFKTEFLATFAKLSKVAKKTETRMWPGKDSYQPAVFAVAGGGCVWLYAVMPLVDTKAKG